MINESDTPSKDLNFDRRLRAIAGDIYESTEGLCLKDSQKLNQEDLCPLYDSIVAINDRYQSPELVGRGGMKEVYRVYDEKTSRYVALAKPLKGYSKDRFAFKTISYSQAMAPRKMYIKRSSFIQI